MNKDVIRHRFKQYRRQNRDLALRIKTISAHKSRDIGELEEIIGELTADLNFYGNQNGKNNKRG